MKTIKAKIIFLTILAGIALLILAILNMYGVSQGNDALQKVYINHINPIFALHEIDHTLLEIKTMISGMTSDQMFDSCARQKLQSMHNKALNQWRLFKETYQDMSSRDMSRDQIIKIDKQFDSIYNFYENSDKYYSNNKNKYAFKTQHDELISFQNSILASLAYLLDNQKTYIKSSYDETRYNSYKYIALGYGVFFVSIIILSIISTDIILKIIRGFANVKDMLSHVAKGDFRKAIYFKQNDEFSDVALSFENTSTHLREIVESVKSAANKAVNSSNSLFAQLDELNSSMEMIHDRVQEVAASMEEVSQNILELTESYRSVNESIVLIKQYASNCEKQSKPSKDLMPNEINSLAGVDGFDGCNFLVDENIKGVVVSLEKTIETIRDYIAPMSEEQLMATEEVSLSLEQISGQLEKNNNSFAVIFQAAKDVSLIAVDLRQLVEKCIIEQK